MFAFFYSIFGFLFRFLMKFIPNYALALLIFTLFFRLIILPTNIHTQKGSAKQMRLQPKIKRIQEKYKDYSPQEKQQKIQEETNALYEKEGYSAMTQGCAPLLIQLPILWGLFGVVRQPLTYVLQTPAALISSLTKVAESMNLVGGNNAYAETTIIKHIDQLAFKIPSTAGMFASDIDKISHFSFSAFGMNFGSTPQFSVLKNFSGSTTEEKLLLLIPLLSLVTGLMTSVLQLVRQKKQTNTNDKSQLMSMGCMMLFMPLWSLYLAFQFPCAMGMYWILSNVLAFFQTLVMGHIYSPKKIIARSMIDETIYRRSYENTKKQAFKTEE